MDTQYLFFVALLITILLIAMQRTEAGRRKFVLLLLVIVGLLLRHNAFLKNLHVETALGIAAGAIVSGLFWLFVGRYNPVGSSDDIKVMGLDD